MAKNRVNTELYILTAKPGNKTLMELIRVGQRIRTGENTQGRKKDGLK